ncbi:MAG: tetratricopeptide repeat protein [Bacteroidales bacterium]|jgi:tetratricopeptide (TPR) repeat protein|nr:tetratricopeptide repeat protein [Bacteroidales bacterium]MCK9448491.1 tetratricopeptide repeat protein [Bacteroidales bacterium]MDD3701591.1 tetratricopeptide repeat protein [Bacteroidales bacterium]MDY0370202.1 tetratricopeptide repeat protein [Bacteroidales bacterium]
MNHPGVYLFLLAFILITACQSLSDKPDRQAVGEINNPLEQLNDAIAKDSTNAVLYNQRAQLYLGIGQADKALMDISNALDYDEANADIFMTLADIYFVMDQPDNVNTSLLKAADLEPENPKPLIKLAELSLLTGKLGIALGFTDKALELNSYNPEAYYVRGMVFLAHEDTLSALKNLQLALDQQDDFYEVLMQIASLYAAQRNELATMYLRKALQLFPDRMKARYELALYLQDNDQFEEALLQYDTLLTVVPNNKYVLFNMGYVYMVYMEQFSKAIEYFDEALLNDPNYIDALYNKGRALEELGRYSNARDIYDEVLRREANYMLAVDGLNRLDRRR